MWDGRQGEGADVKLSSYAHVQDGRYYTEGPSEKRDTAETASEALLLGWALQVGLRLQETLEGLPSLTPEGCPEPWLFLLVVPPFSSLYLVPTTA